MERTRATDKLYARGIQARMHPAEDGQPAAPKEFDLYLDRSGEYRWFAEGEPTDAAGESLRTAVENARLRWKGFQVVELEGHAVTSETQHDIPERYAADDLEKVATG
ncbi:MAG: hypothetical protein R2748_28190 [Bryobacterales bacterium]